MKFPETIIYRHHAVIVFISISFYFCSALTKLFSQRHFTDFTKKELKACAEVWGYQHITPNNRKASTTRLIHITSV